MITEMSFGTVSLIEYFHVLLTLPLCGVISTATLVVVFVRIINISFPESNVL